MVEKRAVLFVNGELPDPGWAKAQMQAGDLVVAVDGGLRFARQAGLLPDMLVGDLDSVAPEEVEQMQRAGIRVARYPPEKDDTDLELALSLALAEGCDSVRLLGALGGRVDQMLGNLFLLAQPALEGVDARILGPGQEIFLIRGQAGVVGQEGDTVSLLPLFGPARGVTTGGLRYPLRGETLWPYRTRGISNVMLGDRAEVMVEEGLLLCVHMQNP